VARKRQEWTFDGRGERVSADTFQLSTRQLSVADMNVVFQPIVDVSTGEQHAVEALARCKRGVFSDPVVLFKQAVADRSVGYLGRVIREVAFSRCAGTVAYVNIHPGELSSRWLVRPDDPLNFHDVDVYLEITETAAFQYFDQCQSVLREVCSRTGAFLVIDDFGAGYSNLKRVIDLEPAIVKLDRELISGMDMNHRQQELVRYVVELCQGLGARVVAEGIETVDELKAVRDVGVHYAQGYLLARPAYPMPEVTWPLTPGGRRRPSMSPGSPSQRPPAPRAAPPPPEPSHICAKSDDQRRHAVGADKPARTARLTSDTDLPTPK
jgi:EAL domain-containing protein (putative c-di-GMP-specific phosphodiesterase class I)